MEQQVKRLKSQQRKLLGKRARVARTSRIQRISYAPSRGGATYSRTMGPLEKKNIDTSGLSFPTFGTATAAITVLNACQAGGLPTNRVGRRIMMSSVFIRGDLFMAPTSTGASPIRMLVVYDRQSNKALAAATDVLTADAISNLGNLSNSHRFRVIRDLILPCIGTAGPQSVYINEYIKLPKRCREVEYIDGAGAGTVADITTGALFVMFYTASGIGTAGLQGNINARVRFTDV